MSCNKNKSNNDETVVNEDYVEAVPVNNFEIMEFTGQFKPTKKAEGAILNVNIKLKNNTSNTINNIEFISAIKVQYKNDDNETYYPGPFIKSQSDLEYLNEPIVRQYEEINNYQSFETKEKWLPNEIKSFNFKVFCKYENGFEKKGFENNIFERTPDMAAFIASYKFIGLDGEYEDLLIIDIIDSWIAHQTKIGLR